MENFKESLRYAIDCTGLKMVTTAKVIAKEGSFGVRIIGWRKMVLKKMLPLFIKQRNGGIKKNTWFSFFKLLNPLFWSIVGFAVDSGYEFYLLDHEGEMYLLGYPQKRN